MYGFINDLPIHNISSAMTQTWQGWASVKEKDGEDSKLLKTFITSQLHFNGRGANVERKITE